VSNRNRVFGFKLDFAMHRNQNTPAKIQRQFVSEKDLEELTGISRRTFQKHRLFGRGPRFYRIIGAVRYDLQEVLDWIRSNAAGGKSA
jgi:predicted DNA-binding transcriptional regulator AlpA